jgi:exoribonuclease R
MENTANVVPPSGGCCGESRPTAAARCHKTAGETPVLPAKKGKQKSADRVIGEEAAHPTTWDDLDGVVVDVEITDWPSATQNPRGRVVEILGKEDDFGVDVEIMIRKFHLPHRFPPEVIDEAQVRAGHPATELKHRRDPATCPRHHRRRNRPRTR